MTPVGPEQVIAAFTAATATAFEEMAGTPVAAGGPTVGPLPPADVRVELPLRQSAEGVLVLAFPRVVLAELVARYLPEGEPAADLLADAAGEFANVIAGQAKTMLKGTPHHFTLGVPRPAAPHAGEFLLLPFACEVGAFTAAVRLPG